MIVKVVVFLSGLAGMVVPNVGTLGLSPAVQGIITGLGAILAGTTVLLEHPTVKASPHITAPTKGS